MIKKNQIFWCPTSPPIHQMVVGNKKTLPTLHKIFNLMAINTGHFRNGIVLGLASARLLSDIILERSPILDPQPYEKINF